LNDFLTTEELIHRLRTQASSEKDIKYVQRHREKKEHTIVTKRFKMIYWITVGLFGLVTLLALLPMILPDRAIGLFGEAMILAIPNDQELDEELRADVILIKSFEFDNIEIGDRIIIYGKFSTDLYWVEEVVSIDPTHRTIDTTFGYFVRNTYDESDVIATFHDHTTTFQSLVYVATTPRGLMSLVLIEILVFGSIYYYFIRDSKEKK